MVNRSILKHLEQVGSELKVWSLHSGKPIPTAERDSIEDVMGNSAHAYGSSNHCLPDDCNGYLYIAAVAAACIEMSDKWIRLQDVEIDG